MQALVRILWVGGLCAACALPCGAQEEQLRERHVLDPEADEWRPLEAPAIAEDAVLGEVRRALAGGETRRARRLLDEWIEQNPGHPREIEARLLRGEVEFQRRDYWRAYEIYESVADEAGGELLDRALRREMDVARAFLAGEKRIVWGFLRLPAYDDGLEILDRIWERAPNTALGEEALRLKADYYYASGEFDLAQEEYAHLAREYPSGRYIRQTLFRAADAANASFPGVEFDDRALLDAEERYRRLQRAFPVYAERQNVGVILDGVRELRATKDLEIARWYEKTGQEGAAEFYYRAVLKDYPGTTAAREAAVHLRSLTGDAPPGLEERAQ